MKKKSKKPVKRRVAKKPVSKEQAIAMATEFFSQLAGQLAERRQIAEHQESRELLRVVVWNAVDGSFQVEGIDTENVVVCTASALSFHEGAQIAARLAQRFDVPCYCLRLSWVAAEGKLAYLPNAMKPLHAAIATANSSHVWN